MFGFQRVGDMIWAFADSRGKGFLMGGTAGRTTLAGEGLQHQDGHSILLASTVPSLATYDPAYSYEIAVIIQDGIRRMYQQGEDLFYYITLYNDTYPMAAMPEGCQEGILKGIYRFKATENKKPKIKVQLFGSGPILNRSRQSSNDPGREVRRLRRCLERYQLQRTSPRCIRDRTLELAPSHRAGEAAVHPNGS